MKHGLGGLKIADAVLATIGLCVLVTSLNMQ